MPALMKYLRRNWGAPFIAGFILLLGISAVELSIGQGTVADSIAFFAFIALVLGVILQISSYVEYKGER
jgi:hypothetical protein